jgi:pentatricopeptide repeat protein
MADIVTTSTGNFVDVLNEFALLVVFFLGFVAFRSPVVRGFFGERKGDPLAEKALAADFASGLWTEVVARGRALLMPSEEALQCVASAMMEVDPPALATVCVEMVKKNSKLSLDSVAAVVLGAPLSFGLPQLEATIAALEKAGATPSSRDVCRAMLLRGVDEATLESRFGDLAHAVSLDVLADTEPPQPKKLVEAFANAPASVAKSSVLPVLESLQRAGADAEALELAKHSVVRELEKAEILALVEAATPKVSSAILAAWTAAGNRVTGNLRAAAAALGLSEADAVTALQQCRSVEKALEVAGQFADEMRPVIVSNLALSVLTQRDIGVAREFFARVPAMGRDVVTFNTILRAEAQAGCWEPQVRVLLAEMKEQKIASNHVTFNTLLHACVTQKGKPWAFLEAMQAQGLRPDAITLTTVLRSVTARDAVHVRRCLSILDSGISQPDEALFSSLLEAAARTSDRSLVSSAVEVSSRYGFPQQNALAALLRSSSTFAEAKALWQELENPTEAEFAAMVGWCCTAGDMAEARELFEQARERGLVGMPTYQLMVKAYAQRKDLEPAWELYEQLRNRGDPLPLALFNSLLDVCSRVGDMVRAEELWRAMPLLGVEPDLISFSTLVKGYCVQGDLEQALATFTQLRRRGLQADSILYHSILDGCANRQMVQLAEQILRDMIADGHKPSSITLSILVKLYGRTSLEQALQVFAELPAQYNFTPNAQVFTCLMSVALTHRDVAEALRIKSAMQATGARPDSRAYTTLVKGCIRWQNFEEAVEVAEEAAASLDATILADLLFVLERRGRSDLAKRVKELNVPQDRHAQRKGGGARRAH